MTAESCVHDDIVFYTGDRSILCYQCKETVDDIIAALRAELREIQEAAREVVTCAANGTNFDSFDVAIATLAQVLERDR